MLFWSLSRGLIDSKLYSGTLMCKGLYDFGVKLRLSFALGRSQLCSLLLSSLNPKLIVRFGLRMLQYSVESLLWSVPGVSISLIRARNFAIGVEQALEKSFSGSKSYLATDMQSVLSSSGIIHF